MYGVGMNNRIYKQRLSTMNPNSGWTLASRGSVKGIATGGNTMYGVGMNNRIYKQTLSTMHPDSGWTMSSRPAVQAIATSPQESAARAAPVPATPAPAACVILYESHNAQGWAASYTPGDYDFRAFLA